MKVELRKMNLETPDPFAHKRVTRMHPWYLVLIAANGEPIATSEGYFSKGNATRAASKNFPEAEFIDTTDKPYNRHGGF